MAVYGEMKKDINHIRDLAAKDFKALYEETFGPIAGHYNRKLLERRLA